MEKWGQAFGKGKEHLKGLSLSFLRKQKSRGEEWFSRSEDQKQKNTTEHTKGATL